MAIKVTWVRESVRQLVRQLQAQLRAWQRQVRKGLDGRLRRGK